jgi:hypothetical protein
MAHKTHRKQARKARLAKERGQMNRQQEIDREKISREQGEGANG